MSEKSLELELVEFIERQHRTCAEFVETAYRIHKAYKALVESGFELPSYHPLYSAPTLNISRGQLPQLRRIVGPLRVTRQDARGMTALDITVRTKDESSMFADLRFEYFKELPESAHGKVGPKCHIEKQPCTTNYYSIVCKE